MIRTISFLLLLIIGASACKKNQLGGKAVVQGYVKHHGKNIPYARVFIKLKCYEFPGNDTNVYDDKVITDVNGYFKINFYKGDYYLYGFGYDYSIPAPHIVSGGTHVYLRYNEQKNMDLYVTEGD